MSSPTLLQQTLRYAERQPIVPVDVDKQPLVPLAKATQKASVIKSWFSSGEPSGIAFRTDRLAVIDVAAGAEQEIARLEGEIGPLPVTRMQSTPSGGQHLLFRLPAGTWIASNTVGPGVELISGASGYVVVAPSQNGAGRYEWVRDSSGKPADIVELPGEWLEHFTAPPGAIAPRPEEGQSDEMAVPPFLEEPSEATEKTAAPVVVESLVAPDPRADLVADVNLTDVGNGIRIATRHGKDLRYCFPFARWLVWDGRRWNTDDDGEPVRRAKENARWLAASALDLEGDRRKATIRWALESEKDARVRAALAMAQSEPGIPVQPDELDTDPWLLNVANGTLDLRTGKLGPHDRVNLITKLAPVSYDPSETAPLWQKVLERALPDPDVRDYVQMLAGYALTGSTREQRISIWWGSGSNAKSTVINTILSLLGEDYGQEAAPSVFLERRSDGIPNDIARLRGARLVIAVETAQNRKLNEALVKAMTGGDRLVARFMRSEFFEFTPNFTPVLVTNHLPVVTDTTHALWRRVDIVPFTQTIADDERDLDLPEKLKAEMPGILNWALAGCLAWQKHGLVRPQAVTDATTGYRSDMDAVGRFIEECCSVAAAATVSSSELYARYEYWAQTNGEEKLSQKAVANQLLERGFRSSRTKAKRLWIGLSLDGDRNEGDNP